MSYNEQIRKLYKQNFTIEGTPQRNFRNPFMIQSSQQLLQNILNKQTLSSTSTTTASTVSKEIPDEVQTFNKMGMPTNTLPTESISGKVSETTASDKVFEKQYRDYVKSTKAYGGVVKTKPNFKILQSDYKKYQKQIRDAYRKSANKKAQKAKISQNLEDKKKEDKVIAGNRNPKPPKIPPDPKNKAIPTKSPPYYDIGIKNTPPLGKTFGSYNQNSTPDDIRKVFNKWKIKNTGVFSEDRVGTPKKRLAYQERKNKFLFDISNAKKNKLKFQEGNTSAKDLNKKYVKDQNSKKFKIEQNIKAEAKEIRRIKGLFLQSQADKVKLKSEKQKLLKSLEALKMWEAKNSAFGRKQGAKSKIPLIPSGSRNSKGELIDDDNP